MGAANQKPSKHLNYSTFVRCFYGHCFIMDANNKKVISAHILDAEYLLLPNCGALNYDDTTLSRYRNGTRPVSVLAVFYKQDKFYEKVKDFYASKLLTSIPHDDRIEILNSLLDIINNDQYMDEYTKDVLLKLGKLETIVEFLSAACVRAILQESLHGKLDDSTREIIDKLSFADRVKFGTYAGGVLIEKMKEEYEQLEKRGEFFSLALNELYDYTEDILFNPYKQKYNHMDCVNFIKWAKQFRSELTMEELLKYEPIYIFAREFGLLIYERSKGGFDKESERLSESIFEDIAGADADGLIRRFLI